MNKSIFEKIVLTVLSIIYIIQVILGFILGFLFVFSTIDIFFTTVGIIVNNYSIVIIIVFIFNLLIRIAIKTVLDLKSKTVLQKISKSFTGRLLVVIFELATIGLLLTVILPTLGYIISIAIICFCMIWTDEASKELVKRIQKSTP